MLFYRQTTDGKKTDCTAALKDAYGGTSRTSAWIIGAGPSLHNLTPQQRQAINNSCAARFTMNYAGRGTDGQGWLIKPTHWTTFDPTPSFSSLIFHDPSIQKFLRSGREMDLVPYGSEKLCDCPNLYFLESGHKEYASFLDPRSDKLNHSLDSFIQTIDLAVHLGFRRLYLIGTEMIVRPSKAQAEWAKSLGVDYDEESSVTVVEKKNNEGVKTEEYESDLLFDFFKMVMQKGKLKDSEAEDKLQELDREGQYSFSERKRFRAACSSDKHYWERTQHLRLARRSIASNGISLISCTPRSRLNHYFPTMEVKDVIASLRMQYGDAEDEKTVGKYITRKHYAKLPYHKDIPPYRVEEPKKKPKPRTKMSPPIVAAVDKNQEPPPLPTERVKEELAAALACGAIKLEGDGGV